MWLWSAITAACPCLLRTTTTKTIAADGHVATLQDLHHSSTVMSRVQSQHHRHDPPTVMSRIALLPTVMSQHRAEIR
jgi:hypothetical protein